jgi:hypothetical protein
MVHERFPARSSLGKESEMIAKDELFGWLKRNGIPYEPATEADFLEGAELLIVDIRRPLDPRIDLSVQAHAIRIERIREDGMVYYRHLPSGREECFVPMKNLLFHGTSVVVRSVSHAEIVFLKAVS